MAEETLRYRVEIDEPSLQSELSRTRGAITAVLQQAVSTGSMAVNSLQSDLAMTRQVLGGPPMPTIARPSTELGFFGSSLGAMGGPPPANMLSFDYQRMAQVELESRMMQISSSVGREALPTAAGMLGSLAAGGGPVGLAVGAGAYLATRGLSNALFNDLETRTSAEQMMSITQAPHPLLRFSPAQRQDLVSGMMEDVAGDVRFGTGDLNMLVAGGQASGAFQGVTNAQEFRSKFRGMMDQLKSITRIFQQTTEEAFGTLSELNQLGPGGAGQGRLGDVLALSRVTGMAPGTSMRLGMAGAQMAAGQGAAMAGGFDLMVQNGMMASAAQATLAIDPATMNQMGGVQGVAGFNTQFGFQAARAPQFRNLLAGLANDQMTGIDPQALQGLISGSLSVDDLRDRALGRLGDPAQRVRFAANADQLQNGLALSGMAGPALFRFAQYQAQNLGLGAEDVFGSLAQQMGLDPMQRQIALTFSRDQGRFGDIASRARQLANLELDIDRNREESRFTSRFAAETEKLRVGFSDYVGSPLREAGRGIEGFVGNLGTLPKRAMVAADVWLGNMIFGGSGEMAPGTPGEARRVGLEASQRAAVRLQNAISDVTARVDFSTVDLFGSLSAGEKDDFEEAAVGTFGVELQALVDQEDPSKRGEMREKLRQDMKGWVRTNYGHFMKDDVREADQFADKLLSIEQLAGRNEVVRRGLSKVVEATGALQMREYVGTEIPGILAHAAGNDRDREKLVGIAAEVAAAFKGKSPGAGYDALRSLGSRALPLLTKGSGIRERLEISEMAMNQGFLRPGDMELDTRELATIREQALTAGQQQFVEELQKAAAGAEGHKLSADQIFRSMGMGLGGQFPSRTPSPGSSLDPYKWDSTALTLDRLSGAVNNLTSASQELLKLTKAEDGRKAGKS